MSGKPEQPKATPATIVKDPGIVRGERFRPLGRTTGMFFVYDPELPPGKRTVEGRTFKTLNEADAFAIELAAKVATKP